MIVPTHRQANSTLSTLWRKAGAMTTTTHAALVRLASKLDDVMHQAQFIANWAADNRLNRYQLENELNILIAEIWDAQSQLTAIIRQETIA